MSTIQVFLVVPFVALFWNIPDVFGETSCIHNRFPESRSSYSTRSEPAEYEQPDNINQDRSEQYRRYDQRESQQENAFSRLPSQDRYQPRYQDPDSQCRSSYNEESADLEDPRYGQNSGERDTNSGERDTSEGMSSLYRESADDGYQYEGGEYRENGTAEETQIREPLAQHDVTYFPPLTSHYPGLPPHHSVLPPHRPLLPPHHSVLPPLHPVLQPHHPVLQPHHPVLQSLYSVLPMRPPFWREYEEHTQLPRYDAELIGNGFEHEQSRNADSGPVKCGMMPSIRSTRLTAEPPRSSVCEYNSTLHHRQPNPPPTPSTSEHGVPAYQRQTHSAPHPAQRPAQNPDNFSQDEPSRFPHQTHRPETQRVSKHTTRDTASRPMAKAPPKSGTQTRSFQGVTPPQSAEAAEDKSATTQSRVVPDPKPAEHKLT